VSAVTLDLGLERPPLRGRRDPAAGVRGERSSCAGRVVARREGARGGLTLDEVVVGVWEGLTAHRTAACPVCGGAMAPRYGSAAAPVGGRCGDCGSTLG
jgi:hypothetical protein